MLIFRASQNAIAVFPSSISIAVISPSSKELKLFRVLRESAYWENKALCRLLSRP